MRKPTLCQHPRNLMGMTKFALPTEWCAGQLQEEIYQSTEECIQTTVKMKAIHFPNITIGTITVETSLVFPLEFNTTLEVPLELIAVQFIELK